MSWLHPFAEQEIQLSDGSLSRLGNVEISNDKPEKRKSSVDESDSATEIGGIGVEEVWKSKSDDPLDEGQRDVSQGLCSRAKTERGNLGDNGEADGANGQLEEEGLMRVSEARVAKRADLPRQR